MDTEHSPLAGWLVGSVLAVPEVYAGILPAFIAGGTIFNLLKEEFPEERKSNYWAFLAGVLLYSFLLLAVD